MHKAVTLSIIIPAYNEERHLVACLESIKNQTIPAEEVIVVDNNSTDETVAIAKRFPFVRVIHEKQQGIVYARDAGFNAARSQIIGRIDADTVLPNDWIERVKEYYDTAGHMGNALTGGGYFYNVRAPRLNGWIQGQIAFRANRLVSGHYILWGSNMAIPQTAWNAVKKDICPRTDIHEDLDLAVHLHALGYHIDYQESLRVGVYLKRVWQNRDKLHEHMQRWPMTLKVHNYRHWWVGVVGNIILWNVIQPVIFIAEGIARLRGKQSIQ